MIRGLFVNSQNSICSIYESGKMCHQSLSKSNIYQLDYIESNNFGHTYDFYIFNQHFYTNNWMTKEFIDADMRGKTFCIVTEVAAGPEPMPYTPKFFDYYILLDPTIKDTNNIFGFSRPLESDEYAAPYVDQGYPIIGSFGFATEGKRWDLIVANVQKEFDRALIKINIPYGTYVFENEMKVKKIKTLCKNIIKKSGIDIDITSNYMSKQELIKWCSQNTLNCFFYYRNIPGLSAVTDQAISAKRPLLLNQGDTFRHILKYMPSWPTLSFKEAIRVTSPIVTKMYDDWCSANFIKKFENILVDKHFM